MNRNQTKLSDQYKPQEQVISALKQLSTRSQGFKYQSFPQERLKNKLMTLGFRLALLLLFGATIGFYLAIYQLKKEQKSVEHIYQVIKLINNTLSEVSKAEQGRNSLNLFPKKSSDNFIKISLTNPREIIQYQIEIVLTQMEQAEQKILSQRQKTPSKKIYQINWIVGVGYFLSFSLLLIIYRQLKQEIQHRHQAEQNLYQINKQLETRIEDRTVELTQLNTILKNEIEERKQLEQLLRESEERFRQAIFEAPLPIIIHAEDGEILQINWAWLDISGYQAEEIPTISDWTQKVYKNNYKTIKAYIRQLFELNQRIAEGEYTLINRQGKTLIWDYYSAPLKTLADGRKVRITMALDVTKRKQAELALQASEHRYSTLTELAPVGIFRTDPKGHYVYVNQQWCQITGLTAEQAIETGWMTVLHPEDRQRVISEWICSLSNHSLFYVEYRFQSPQGKITWVVGQAIAETTLQGEIIGYIGTITDISERKETEQELRKAKAELEIRVTERTAELKESNKQLQQELAEKQQTQKILTEQAQLLDLAHDIIMSHDLDGMILFWNQGAQKIYGFSKEEALGHNSHLLLKTQFPEPLIAIFANLFAQDYWEGELIQQKRDGQTIIVASRWVLQRDKQGKPSKILEINNDITARKQAEEALQQNEAKFYSLCESSPIGIFLTNTQGHILYTNPRYQEIAGATVQEVLGEGWKQFIHPEDHETIVSDWIANLGHQQNSFYPEVRFYHKNGNIRYAQVYTSVIFTDKGQLTGFVGTVEDITERRQIEQMKKDFISIVSHELKTPLTSIYGSLGLLAAGVYDNKPEKGKKMIQIAATQTNRLVKLVSDILDLGRLESGNLQLVMQSCNATTLMQQAIEVMRAKAEETQITLLMIPLDVPVWADFDAIIQTLTNLLSNAIKFSPPNSTILLKAELVSLDDNIEVLPGKSSAVSLLSPPYVLFQVQDQGRGIPANKLELIFEKFQQIDASDSREKGGTGLGLAICRTIVEQHRGQIWPESILGEGSIFYFTLPLPPDL